MNFKRTKAMLLACGLIVGMFGSTGAVFAGGYSNTFTLTVPTELTITDNTENNTIDIGVAGDIWEQCHVKVEWQDDLKLSKESSTDTIEYKIGELEGSDFSECDSIWFHHDEVNQDGGKTKT